MLSASSGRPRIYRLMVFKNQCFFEFLFLCRFWFDLGYPLGYHFGEKSVKVCAKTAFREVAKRVRKKR